MFYFFLQPLIMYNWILILAAVIPAVFLMIKVYKADRLEREDPGFLWNLVTAGVLSSLIALLIERLSSWILGRFVAQDDPLYNVILYFVIVAFAEEGSKFYMLKRRTWNSSEFNCQYDGLLYAVFVSLGFALWENISYVMQYGFQTAVVRAVTAIPGHACFGVFMGAFYGLAKKYDRYSMPGLSAFFRVFSLLIPAVLHGLYDYIASSTEILGEKYFIIFVVILFVISYIITNRASKHDIYIS